MGERNLRKTCTTPWIQLCCISYSIPHLVSCTLYQGSRYVTGSTTSTKAVIVFYDVYGFNGGMGI